MSFIIKNFKLKTVRYLIISTLSGTLITLSGIMISAFLYYKSGESIFIKIIPYILISISGFVCGHIYKRKTSGKGIVIGLFSGVILALFTSLMFLILNQFKVDVNYLITLFLQIIFSAVGGIEAANIKNEF